MCVVRVVLWCMLCVLSCECNVSKPVNCIMYGLHKQHEYINTGNKLPQKRLLRDCVSMSETSL